ncbi:hypothetical protein IHE33_09740 [Mycetohabitans endofungorum]|uniref:hypothetical protein n=1 Tax=Mycetohabitans endofungorum TaxID=417203 RepID=UPI0030D31E93
MRLVGRDGSQPQDVLFPSRVPSNPFIGKRVVGAAGSDEPDSYVPPEPGMQPDTYALPGGAAPVASLGWPAAAGYPVPPQNGYAAADYPQA